MIKKERSAKLIDERIAVNRIARQFVDVGPHVPVVTVPGDSLPKLVGRGYYFTTPSGKTIILYPSAYRWKKLYHASTRAVKVGEEWVKAVKSCLAVAPLANPFIFWNFEKEYNVNVFVVGGE